MNSVNKNEYIDYLKGLAIFLVVVGHCWLTEYGMFWFIYRFHMPLFFCISGYLFKNNRTFKQFIFNKLKHIILPYFVYFVISFVLVNIYFEPVSISNAFKYFLLNGSYLIYVNNYALWYLPLFFLVSLIFYFILKVKNKYVYYIIIFIFGIFTVPSYRYMHLYFNDFIPFSLQVLPAGIFYLGIGKMIKDIKIKNYLELIKNYNLIAIFISILCFLLGLYFTRNDSIQILNITSYSYLISSLFIIVSLIIATYKNNNYIFVYLGKRTLPILGLHRIFLFILSFKKIDIFLLKYNITGFLASLIVSSFCICIICILYEIFNLLKSFVFRKILVFL